MAPGAALEVEIEEKRFPVLPEPLFARLCFRVAPSSILVLVGPSGIGKSTLLRMIAGIDNDFSGRIRVDGTTAARASPPGFVFQDPRLLPWLDASANIRAVSPSIARSRAAELLSEVGLAGFESALPHELSGGMQRRVALARALATAPRLLLLDEPFVSLDQTLVQELQSLFLGIVADYRPSVILVSHSGRDAARLGDRVLVLAGRPAKISAEMELAPARAARGPQDVDRLAHDLADRMELAQ